MQPSYGEADDAEVRSLIQNVEKLRVEANDDFVAEGVTDFAKYSLEEGKPKRLHIEAKQRVGSLLGGDEKKEPVSGVLLIGDKADDKGEKVYARLEGETYVVKVPAKNLDPIFPVAREPGHVAEQGPRPGEAGKVDASMSRAPAAGSSCEDRRAGRLEDRRQFRLLHDSRVVGRAGTAGRPHRQEPVKDFPTRTDAELGLDKPVAEFSLWVEGIQKEEKKTDKPDDKTKKDEKKDPDAEPKLKDDKPRSGWSSANREGHGLRPPRDRRRQGPAGRAGNAAGQVHGPLAYLDRTLPTFDARAVKLALTRGSDTYEMEREKKDDKVAAEAWQVQTARTDAGRPDADASRRASSWSTCATLATDKLVAEKPSDADLERSASRRRRSGRR